MRLSKAIQLLKLLNNKELVRFKELLKRDKRTRLLNLTEWLTANQKSLDERDFKPDLFQFLFQEPFDNRKSYLLRNEFRLLTEQLQTFLVELQITKETQENEHVFKYYLFSAIQDRDGQNLIRREYKTTFDDSLKRADYFLSFNLNTLNANQYRQFFHEDENMLDQAEKVNKLRIKHLCSFFVTEQRQYLFNRALLAHLRFPFSVSHFQFEDSNPMSLDSKTNRADYLLFKAKSYLHTPDKRTSFLKQCLDFASKNVNKKNGSFYQDEVRYCLIELASYFNQIDDLQTAQQYYEQFLQLPVPPDDIYRLSLLLDYAGLLLSNQQPVLALKHLQDNEKHYQSFDKLLVRMRCLKTAVLAIIGDTDELFKSLPVNFTNLGKDEKYFFRLYYGIQAWLSKMPGEAIREVDNLLNSIQKGAQPGYDVRPVARMLKRFFQWAMPPQWNHLKKLKTEVEVYQQNSSEEYRTFLPFLWLKKEMDALFSD